jgi:DNA-binding transcriptional ArsR family regulator
MCKFSLTGETSSGTRPGDGRRAGARAGDRTLNNHAGLLAVLTAMANQQRMRVVAELGHGRVHVSELARRLGMSRPLLYMHLDRLEKAGLVAGQLELSEDGKAMKYFELVPFEFRLNAQTITDAVRAEEAAPDSGGPD